MTVHYPDSPSAAGGALFSTLNPHDTSAWLSSGGFFTLENSCLASGEADMAKKSSFPWRLLSWSPPRVGQSSSAGFHGSAFPLVSPLRGTAFGWAGKAFGEGRTISNGNLPQVCGQRNSASVGVFPQSPLSGVYFYPAELKGREGVGLVKKRAGQGQAGPGL